ncbi:MAG: DEAD/DEAH box helicase family protein [Archangiaceae bacterium]|nr:DEAD/DEAH box helicase family protein [Archangiaceae bacterium]
MSKLVLGQKVRYVPQPEWGIGHLATMEDEGTKAQVIFPARDGGPILVSTKGGALVPAALKPGDAIRTHKGATGRVVEEVEGGRGLRRYVLKMDDGTDNELPESEIRAQPPRPDMLTMLKEARVGDSKGFLLRRSALALDDERRNDALGALLASRVMVKPHQVGVVQRVLTSPRPRFVLADEVGLGKTIEAGMIFSALRLAGLTRRVLVVAPSHLTVQWLVELFHKFNQLFTLMDTERYEKSLEELPGVSPWTRFDFVVTSLEMLQRNPKYREEAAAEGAFWDLVIIDEAHHLKGEKAYEAASGLSKNCWGLLLLTATPMQLDPAEYQKLLELIDPKTAPTVKGFEERLAKQEELSQAVRALIDGKDAAAAVKKLAKQFPQDDQLRDNDDPKALLDHLAETYSLSERLIRNRRAVVGGFSKRVLHRHEVKLNKEEEKIRTQVLEALGKSSLKGAPLAGVLRRFESSTAALWSALKSTQALESLTLPPMPERDAKMVAFDNVLKGIWAKEKDAKILVFTESRETLESLQARLRDGGTEALAYHGDLPLVERDRQVARFRDPDGPKVLICTEVGGEGRNFQFSHHLVNYDLPWSPSVAEQRIGRLDRIGQTQDVQIHVFEVKGSLSADVLTILADAVGVFGETVGGLDAVLEEVEPKLTELALAKPKERAAYVAELKTKVTAAREQVKRAYDPLLDRRSFDEEQVEALVKRAHERIDHEGDDDDTLEDGLRGVAQDLDERLEETVTELAQKVGLGVDTDQNVEAFQCAFTFGHALNVEALPGLDIQKERTVLGTFWRDTAVDHEEIEYFATGHPIVEGLFGFLRDGPFGRNGARYLEVRGPVKHRGVEVLFHLTLPDPIDVSPGARVPSRQLSRFLDRLLIHVAVVSNDGKPKVDASLLSTLKDVDGRSLKGDEIRAAFANLPEFLEPAIAAATTAAKKELDARAAKAKKAIEAERATRIKRLTLALTHQGVPAAAIAKQVEVEKAHADALLEALAGVTVQLDSACAFVINR